MLPLSTIPLPFQWLFWHTLLFVAHRFFLNLKSLQLAVLKIVYLWYSTKSLRRQLYTAPPIWRILEYRSKSTPIHLFLPDQVLFLFVRFFPFCTALRLLLISFHCLSHHVAIIQLMQPANSAWEKTGIFQV